LGLNCQQKCDGYFEEEKKFFNRRKREREAERKREREMDGLAESERQTDRQID